MRERRRLEKQDFKQFREEPGSEDEWPEIEALMVRPKEPGSDARFAELVAAVTPRDAAILWLRFYRHLSPRQIAYALDLGPSRGDQADRPRHRRAAEAGERKREEVTAGRVGNSKHESRNKGPTDGMAQTVHEAM